MKKIVVGAGAALTALTVVSAPVAANAAGKVTGQPHKTVKISGSTYVAPVTDIQKRITDRAIQLRITDR